MKSRKVVILGSLGFIGSALTRQFQGQSMPSVQVIPVATGSTGRVSLDKDASWLVTSLQGVDTVYNVAGRTGGVGRMAKDPLSFVFPNMHIQLNVMEACAKAGVRRYVSGQSITGYPDVAHPVREDEYHTGELHTAYFVPGNTWRFIDRAAQMVSKASGLEVVFVRPSNVYGPRNDFDPVTAHVIEATIRKFAERQNPMVVWGTGEEKRDPTYVDDLAEAMTLCIDCPPGAYNIGTGQSVSVNEMIGMLAEHTRYQPNLEYDRTKPTAIPTRYLDCSWTEQVLGWKPKTLIREGLAATYDWWVSRLRQRHEASLGV